MTWVGGWGLNVRSGKAQGSTTASRKLHDLIKATGEYTIEAWVAPGNVAQEDSRIVSYSGGTTTRNFMLGQTLYSYDFYNRSASTNTAGDPKLTTAAADEDLQATLQHVVATFDPVRGRRIYVNGEFTGDADPVSGGAISDWDDTFAFVLGNEVSGDRQFQGVFRLVAVYNRVLTDAQIQTNFTAGVGEKFYLLFSISHLVNVPQAYILFEVSQFDSYSYLFNQPTFISLDPAARPGSIPIAGMRIGVNGTEAPVGQAYRTLDTTITDSQYGPLGQPLATVGTVIALEKGPDTDEFFLTFDVLGAHQNVRLDPVPLAPAPPADVQRPSDVGLRVFDELNATMAELTGISPQDPAVAATYATIKQSLPTVETVDTFVSAHPVAVAQLVDPVLQCAGGEPDGACAVLPRLRFHGRARNRVRAGRTDDRARRAGGSHVADQRGDRARCRGRAQRPRRADHPALELRRLLRRGPHRNRRQGQLRRVARQRRDAVALTAGRCQGRTMLIRKTPPRALALDEPIRHQEAHKRPVTRRDFLSQGFGTGLATIAAPGIFSLFANPRSAMAALSPDIEALKTTCGIDVQGAGKIPFICIDLAGGANMVGSNVLIGGPGGQLDFLSTAGYGKLGLPGDMLPGMTNATTGTSFTDSRLGLVVPQRQRIPARHPRSRRTGNRGVGQRRGDRRAFRERHRQQPAQPDVWHPHGRCRRLARHAGGFARVGLGRQLDGAGGPDRPLGATHQGGPRE